MHEFSLFSGTANMGLAEAVSREMRVPLGARVIERFPDGELTVRLLDAVRRNEVFIIQPLSPPVNEHLVELLVFADAARRAAASSITAIVPYMGYARADKRHGRREPITARVVADLMQAVGIAHVLTVDLHVPQIEGFFHAPVDSLTAVPTLYKALGEDLPPDAVVVAPDAGAMRMATEYAHRIGTPVVVLHKRRETGTETKVTHLVGDVTGKACLVVDDMISTGGTMAESIEALLAAGARPEITVAATHGLFLPGAREKLAHPAVRRVYVTDTVPVNQKDWPQLRVVSIAPLIAAALQRFVRDVSISDLY